MFSASEWPTKTGTRTHVAWTLIFGSTIFFVWQRSQFGRDEIGDFAFGRDVGALFDAPADNRFIVKVNYWLGM